MGRSVVYYAVPNDVDPSNYKFSNRRLETTLLVAAQLIGPTMDFVNSYDINVETCKLDPDPTDSDTKIMIS